ncbi:unnamed protein product [marine sediment metagenome]|uniref:Uncharacterized protein n=1 Tax=marine sediment metagenome TaxID=412755 RepID=X1JI18_9ZZZZ
MARYKKFEYLPWWLNNLNDSTLTPTQKEVLDLDYYCKKHGTRLSHDRAAKKLDRGRHTVYTARRRLEELALRSTEPAKGSFKLGHIIEYQNEAQWLAVLRARGVDPRRFKMKRKSSQKNNTSLRDKYYSSSKAAEASATEAGVSTPQTPAGLAVQGGVEVLPGDDEQLQHAADSPELQKVKDACLWEVIYREALDKYLKNDLPRERAELHARLRADKKVAKRNSEQKTGGPTL